MHKENIFEKYRIEEGGCKAQLCFNKLCFHKQYNKNAIVLFNVLKNSGAGVSHQIGGKDVLTNWSNWPIHSQRMIITNLANKKTHISSKKKCNPLPYMCSVVAFIIF